MAKEPQSLTIDGDYEIHIKGKLTIHVAGGIAITSDGNTTINAAVLELNGATVKLTGKASGEVNGGGVLNLKGGMVKIN